MISLEPPTTKQTPILSWGQPRLALEQAAERGRTFVAYLLTDPFDAGICRLKDLLGFFDANSMNVVHRGITGRTPKPARKGCRREARSLDHSSDGGPGCIMLRKP